MLIVRALATVPRRLTPLALAAAGLALLVPSRAVAADSDVLLAALVLFTALGISADALWALRRHALTIAGLSIVPMLVLAAVGWALGRPFGADTQHGLLGTGLASAEVASVGLVGIAPLGVGVAIRTGRRPRSFLADYDGPRDGVAGLAVVALVYASLSGTHGAYGLATATLTSALFLLVSAALAVGWLRLAGTRTAAAPGAFTIAMRDFAVAATLATQAFGREAGTVPGIYGVLMLIGGSLVAGRLRRR